MSFQDKGRSTSRRRPGHARRSHHVVDPRDLGLLICSLICSPLAIVYGKRARRAIAASGGRLGGGGQATAGIVMGWIGVGFLILGIVVVVIFIIAAVATSA